MDKYIYTFNRYLREEFGQRVHRISLDAGFNCPNLDGTLDSQGCIFCNNRAFSRFRRLPPLSLEEQIIQGKARARQRFKAKKYIAYFQSFSNTYGDIDFLRKQYNLIRKFDDFVGIAISTRPDCIDQEKLDLIEEFSNDYKVYIEYGLQTIHDKTLKLINRKHTFSSFQKAVELTARRPNINIGVHVILGLPGENKEDALNTAKVLANMPLWGIKFHALHIVKDTTLADMHKRYKVKLLSIDEYTDILVSFLEQLPENYVILRLVSEADPKFLITPAWVNDKERVIRIIEAEFKRRQSSQGAFYNVSNIV